MPGQSRLSVVDVWAAAFSGDPASLAQDNIVIALLTRGALYEAVVFSACHKTIIDRRLLQETKCKMG